MRLRSIPSGFDLDLSIGSLPMNKPPIQSKTPSFLAFRSHPGDQISEIRQILAQNAILGPQLDPDWGPNWIRGGPQLDRTPKLGSKPPKMQFFQFSEVRVGID